jgi:hypothetical protein
VAELTCPECGNPRRGNTPVCLWCNYVFGAALASVDALVTPTPIVREPSRNTNPSGVPPLPLSPALLIIGAAGVPIPVEPGEVILGRLSSDDRIGKALNPYDDVSRYHTALTVRGSHVEVRDLGSMHGTRVENRRLTAGETEYFDLPVMLRLASGCYVRVEPRE